MYVCVCVCVYACVYVPPCVGVESRDDDDPGRQRTASEGHFQDRSPTEAEPIRSPIRCISPEMANTIALNPGGRPKEVAQRHP